MLNSHKNLNNLIFSTVWEDENTVIDSLSPSGNDDVLTITSGGCLSLSFLARGVSSVTSVDKNVSQNALLELKLCLPLYLTRRDAWRFLGLLPSKDRVSTYRMLEADLTDAARGFWNNNISLIAGGSGLSGHFDKFTHRTASMISRLFPFIKEIIYESDAVARETMLNSLRDNRIFRLICNLMTNERLISFLLSKSRYEKPDNTRWAIDYIDSIANMLIKHSVNENPYLYYIFRQTYPDSACNPYWLSIDGYRKLRERRNNLTIHTSDLLDFIRSVGPEKYSLFNLSNSLDWMNSEHRSQLLKNVVRTAIPGARFCLWSNVLNNTNLEFEVLDTGNMLIDKNRSENLLRDTRIAGYRHFYIGYINKA